MRVTETDILTALQEAMQKPQSQDGVTVTELIEASKAAGEKFGEEKIRGAIKALLRDGRARVLKVYRESIDGRMQLVPAYQLVKKAR